MDTLGKEFDKRGILADYNKTMIPASKKKLGISRSGIKPENDE